MPSKKKITKPVKKATASRDRLLTPAQVKQISLHCGPPSETFVFKTMSKKQLAAAYEISVRTLKKWIDRMGVKFQYL